MDYIRFQDVSFSYSKDKEILSNLNLSLDDLGLVVILGRSGSGKSTFLSLLNNSLKPTSGKIIKDNKIKIANSFQSPLLLDYLNVKDNVALPLYLNRVEEIEVEEKVNQVLNKVGLLDFKEREVTNLSGGEKMRVSIARALSDEANVLVLDEPTGALDENTSKEIYSLIQELSKEILVILVTHDEKSAREIADRLYVLNNGKLELIKSKEIIKREEKTKVKELEKRHITYKKGLYLNYKYLIKHKVRVILCLVFLSLSFSFQYIGLNIYRNIDNSLDKILDNFYASSLAFITRVEEVKTSSNLKLEKESLPSKKDLDLLGIKKAKNSLEYFIPQYKEININNIKYDCRFIPVISEDKNKLKIGKGIEQANSVVVNSLFIEMFHLDENKLDQSFYFNHQFLVKDKSDSSDLCNLELTFSISGVSKESTFFSEPIVYYSYTGIEEYLATIECKNITKHLGYETSVLDVFNSYNFINNDINSRTYIFEEDNVNKIREKVNKESLKFKVTSKTLEIYESTKEIVLSATKIVSVYLVLFIVLSSMLLFLSMYSLYEDNTRFLALTKIFSSNKINNLILTLTNGIIFFSFAFGLIFIFALINTGIGNMIFSSLNFPPMIRGIDIISLLLIVLVLLIVTLVTTLFSRFRIRDSKIKKELEGED